MIAIIFLCMMKRHLFAMFVWNFTTTSLSIAEILLFIKKWSKMPSPTLPSLAYQANSSHSSRTTLLPTVPVKLLRCWAVKRRISSRHCSGLRIVRTSIQSTMRSGAGVAERRVYCSRIRDVNHLKERLIEEWCNLHHNIICAVVNQWRTRLRACVRADGGHFEVWTSVVTATATVTDIYRLNWYVLETCVFEC